MFNHLKERVVQYIDVHIKLFKLDFIEKTANLLSYFMYSLITLFIFFGILIFLGFGVVEAFAAMGLSRMLSFFATVGVFVLLLIIAIVANKFITRFFASTFIRIMTAGDIKKAKKNSEEEEESDIE